VRQRFLVANDAEINMAGIGLDGDVECQAMHDDGQWVEGQKAGAGQVQGLWRIAPAMVRQGIRRGFLRPRKYKLLQLNS
jgi:hypothetical protein